MASASQRRLIIYILGLALFVALGVNVVCNMRKARVDRPWTQSQPTFVRRARPGVSPNEDGIAPSFRMAACECPRPATAIGRKGLGDNGDEVRDYPARQCPTHAPAAPADGLTAQQALQLAANQKPAFEFAGGPPLAAAARALPNEPAWQTSDVFLVRREGHLLPRRNGVKLVVGIPTLARPENKSYLSETLRSLIARSSQEELDAMLIVIFLADMDKNKAMAIYTQFIHPEFEPYVRDGLIDVITAKKSAYPVYPTPLPRRTFNDPEDRVKWRSKQCFDFALLMEYSKGRGDYYLQLEDDVLAADNFASSILAVVDESSYMNPPWSMLEFSRLGFIGKLFRDTELLEMAAMFRFYHYDQPVDYLMTYFIQIKTQGSRLLTKYALFQHIGTQSTLPGKIQRLTDPSFRQDGETGGIDDSVNDALPMDRRNWPRNPPAVIKTNIDHYSNFDPRPWYNNRRVFWAPVHKGSYFIVQFNMPLKISQVLIHTSHPTKPADLVEHGALAIATDAAVSDFREVLSASGPKFEWTSQDSRLITGLKFTVTADQGSWAVFSRITIIPAN
ncbi:hypothetical protein CAOG_04096 [Capsaspora owczarzaki ATCC 30864]|uniref:MGAT4 conserved region domain-containing protein n=1 Tax=Capsaspora owczarzaki (strain ATCC 30864) TaxID=595528 RepID=A0A0D2X2W9_CAPO3|nr:hypothetical protein CAOG_04096 [Capsaspora owczarzaki ATCC 30864]KJE93289.1 hypothetical protein CAOG_004096 [Capsaspora owczarzaki ATCC 30864]|eukprot:XP_004347921.1 hypothetical protein CAOG_04096 [Capsaspora owczarzaki ATCC 30864]